MSVFEMVSKDLDSSGISLKPIFHSANRGAYYILISGFPPWKLTSGVDTQLQK